VRLNAQILEPVDEALDIFRPGQPLADYLDARVFADAASTTEAPDANDVAGFEAFFDRFRKGLPIEHAAIESIPLETK